MHKVATLKLELNGVILSSDILLDIASFEGKENKEEAIKECLYNHTIEVAVQLSRHAFKLKD